MAGSGRLMMNTLNNEMPLEIGAPLSNEDFNRHFIGDMNWLKIWLP